MNSEGITDLQQYDSFDNEQNVENSTENTENEETEKQSADDVAEELSSAGDETFADEQTEINVDMLPLPLRERTEVRGIEEPDGYIYFDESKQAYAQPIDDYICKIPLEQWKEFCLLTLGKEYDIIDGDFVDLRQTPEYIAEKFTQAQELKHAENTRLAKLAVENGYVTFKEAKFETNAQTVGDLTATMLMLQAQSSHSENTVILSGSEVSIGHSEDSSISSLKNPIEEQADSLPAVQNDNITYTWLSKDDKAVELTLEDFITLGNLIAECKNTIWSNKYLSFKTAIEQAQTLEELENIEINYNN